MGNRRVKGAECRIVSVCLLPQISNFFLSYYFCPAAFLSSWSLSSPAWCFPGNICLLFGCLYLLQCEGECLQMEYSVHVCVVPLLHNWVRALCHTERVWLCIYYIDYEGSIQWSDMKTVIWFRDKNIPGTDRKGTHRWTISSWHSCQTRLSSWTLKQQNLTQNRISKEDRELRAQPTWLRCLNQY